MKPAKRGRFPLLFTRLRRNEHGWLFWIDARACNARLLFCVLEFMGNATQRAAAWIHYESVERCREAAWSGIWENPGVRDAIDSSAE
jgi:hypothetical protein